MQRYAGRLPAAEINTSFYRSHRPDTWARWRDSTPENFRFAVKAPKTLTHEARLTDAGERLEVFLAEAALLGPKLGPILLQTPPSLAFDAAVADGFFSALRDRFSGGVACEPRHATWFTPEADALLRSFRVARVAADPARPAGADQPGGWTGLAYWRLHGSPRMYYSEYGAPALVALAAILRASPAAEVWCVLDNTASGAAAADALALRKLSGPRRPASGRTGNQTPGSTARGEASPRPTSQCC